GGQGALAATPPGEQSRHLLGPPRPASEGIGCSRRPRCRWPESESPRRVSRKPAARKAWRRRVGSSTQRPPRRGNERGQNVRMSVKSTPLVCSPEPYLDCPHHRRRASSFGS